MTDDAAAATAAASSFTFGEPEGVLDRRDLWSLLEVWSHNGRWFEWPIAPAALIKAERMSPHHRSAMILKRNLLARAFVPSTWLDRATFVALAHDYLALGNAFAEAVPSVSGRIARVRRAPAISTRVGVEPGRHWFLERGGQAHPFAAGSVAHIAEPDLSQEIYGLPDWLAGLQAGLLNEAATLFRRRYYVNGAHAGFILYVAEEKFSNEDSDALRAAMKESKGVGNFKNLFLHIPGGREKGVQIIPIAEVAARDEFMGVKNVTRDDMLAAHRVPPQLIGVVPTNAGGFGSIAEAAAVFWEHEIEPLQARMIELNDQLGVEAVRFDPDRAVGAGA